MPARERGSLPFVRSNYTIHRARTRLARRDAEIEEVPWIDVNS
jgi:hypothetical protein